MARPLKQKISQAKLAEMAGVEPKTLRVWRDTEGLDLNDTAAVLRRAAEVQKKASDSESLAGLKRRKLLLECRRIELAIQRENEHFVPAEKVHQSANIFFNILRSCFREMEGFLPEILNGLSAPAMGKEIQRVFYEVQEKLACHEFMDNHVETKRLKKEFERCDRLNLCHECRQSKDYDHED
jgi:transcriptional regulator with XRE-family HTH domain